MLKKIDVVSSILQDWKSDPTRPRQSYRYSTQFDREPEFPLTGEEVERYKEFLLNHGPITYRELFPDEKKGIRIPGIEFSGQSPNACAAAYWHAARAEQFLKIYLDQDCIEGSNRKKYREIFMRLNDLALNRCVNGTAEDEEENNINNKQ